MTSKINHRSISTAISTATRRLVDDFRERTIKIPAITRKQLLDKNQIQRLSLTLNRPQLYRDLDVNDDSSLASGTPIPPGYHLVYFTPAVLSEELGSDGTDVSYSPGKPFTRRMWAGGEIKWEKRNPLRMNDEVTETTKFVSAEPKITRAGEEMIVVGVEKTFENARGLALIDKRDWVFRTQLLDPAPIQDPAPADVKSGTLPRADKQHKERDFFQTPVSLFRFSALTFNGHMLHYSRPWCRNVEGHKDLVVHGPLNLVNMLDFWRDSNENDYMIPQSLHYRATAPFYADEQYRALLKRGTGSTSIRIWCQDGKGDVRVGMLGDFTD